MQRKILVETVKQKNGHFIEKKIEIFGEKQPLSLFFLRGSMLRQMTKSKKELKKTIQTFKSFKIEMMQQMSLKKICLVCNIVY